MRAKREKRRKNKIIPIILVILIILITILIVYLIKKNNYNNLFNSKVNNNLTSQIMAYVYNTGKDEVLEDGKKFDSSLLIYANNGNIESITYNNAEFEGKNLKEDGDYVITMKPDNGEKNITITVKIDKVKPTLQYGNLEKAKELYSEDKAPQGTPVCKTETATVTVSKGMNKISLAELIKIDTNDKEVTKTSILDDLQKEEGHRINERGKYKIKLTLTDGTTITTQEFIAR